MLSWVSKLEPLAVDELDALTGAKPTASKHGRKDSRTVGKVKK